jgi:hypothetical protein
LLRRRVPDEVVEGRLEPELVEEAA